MAEYFTSELGISNSEKSVEMRNKQQAYTHVKPGTSSYAKVSYYYGYFGRKGRG